MNCDLSRNSISSPAAGYGLSQHGTPDGLINVPLAPPLAPASPTAQPESNSAQMIQGICGRTYFESSVPPATQDSALLFGWENRLRKRLAMVGSTECALIWREKESPQGLSISRLARSTRHTNGTDSTGSQWPTPTSSAAGNSSRSGERKDEPLMGGLMRGAQWATPRAGNGGIGHPKRMDNGKSRLEDQVFLAVPKADLALWITPSARDGKDSVGMVTTRPDGGNRIDQLPRQMIAVPDATAPGTPTQSGSPVTTAKRGAPNPIFPCWLMGWSDEVIYGALRGIQSFRSSRRKSSKHSSTLSGTLPPLPY